MRDTFRTSFRSRRGGFTPQYFIAFAIIAIIAIVIMFISPEKLFSNWNRIKGELIGNSYDIMFYDNYGAKSFTAKGNKVSVNGIRISTGSETTELSSVIKIIIDGKEIESCGDTVIFAGEGLTPIIDFTLNDIVSNSDNDVTSLTSVGKIINAYKNDFGKSRVVVIKSQLGVPICAFEGDSVYYEIPSDLPKMTLLSIDGKPLYIHRANLQIIDSELIE